MSYMYEKEGKVNIVLGKETKQIPVEQPDVVIEQYENESGERKIKVTVGTEEIEG